MKRPGSSFPLWAAGCVAILLLSGALKVSSDLLGRGVGSYTPMAHARASARGTIDLHSLGSWQELGEHPKGFDDDALYQIAMQFWAIAGGDCSLHTVSALHNGFVIVCALSFSLATLLMTRRITAGWVSLALALVLRWRLAGLLFGALDHHRFIIPFPLLYILLIVLLPAITRRVCLPAGFLAALSVGAVVEVAGLIRRSEGIIAFAGILAACLLVNERPRLRAATAALLVAGSYLAGAAVPITVRLFNDVQMGRYDGTLLPYLKPLRAPHHATWHSLLISVGRYPNALQLWYSDPIGWRVARESHPDLWKQGKPVLASRATYLEYITDHPEAYLRYVLGGMIEVPLVIAYVPSVGRYPWALGYLPAKEGVVPDLVSDPRDVPYDRLLYPRIWVGHGILLNLRPRYLKLGPLAWGLYGGSVAVIAGALLVARAAGDSERLRLFLSLLVYTGLGALVRGLIPAHGQALVVAYWALAVLALSYLGCRLRPMASILRGRRRSGGTRDRARGTPPS